MRSGFLGRYKKSSKQKVGSQPEQEQQPEKKVKSSPSQGGDGWFCCPWKKGKQQGFSQSFGHIKELKAAGIYVKPSRTSSLTDISFNSYFFYGHLKLPPITIDSATKARFLNMVAYEMCAEVPDDYGVASYICFLDNLIDHADDVKELRSKHILYNLLGSDEDVAQLFNEIVYGFVEYPETYGGVKDSIQKHIEKRWNTWIAEALSNYLRSPWTFMALIAAVLILIVSGVQTYYAHPGKYIIYLYVGSIMIVMCFFLVRCVRD